MPTAHLPHVQCGTRNQTAYDQHDPATQSFLERLLLCISAPLRQFETTSVSGRIEKSTALCSALEYARQNWAFFQIINNLTTRYFETVLPPSCISTEDRWVNLIHDTESANKCFEMRRGRGCADGATALQPGTP